MPHVAPLLWTILYILLITLIICLTCSISWFYISTLKIKNSKSSNSTSMKWDW